MGDAYGKESADQVQVVGDGNQNCAKVTDEGEVRVRELINEQLEEEIINVTGAGVEAYANVNNTVGGNLSGRKFLRIINLGGRVRVRKSGGSLSGNQGERLNTNESIEYPYGEDILMEIREQNGSNEINVIIQEGK